MLLSAWLFVGVIAFIMTLVTIGAAALEPPSEDTLTMISGITAFVIWGIWTFGGLQITVVSQGSELTFAHSELVFLGVIMALIPGYFALTGPFEIVDERVRETSPEDL